MATPVGAGDEGKGAASKVAREMAIYNAASLLRPWGVIADFVRVLMAVYDARARQYSMDKLRSEHYAAMLRVLVEAPTYRSQKLAELNRATDNARECRAAVLSCRSIVVGDDCRPYVDADAARAEFDKIVRSSDEDVATAHSNQMTYESLLRFVSGVEATGKQMPISGHAVTIHEADARTATKGREAQDAFVNWEYWAATAGLTFGAADAELKMVRSHPTKEEAATLLAWETLKREMQPAMANGSLDVDSGIFAEFKRSKGWKTSV